VIEVPTLLICEITVKVDTEETKADLLRLTPPNTVSELTEVTRADRLENLVLDTSRELAEFITAALGLVIARLTAKVDIEDIAAALF
jgi:CheY-specific phosphatase CheX